MPAPLIARKSVIISDDVQVMKDDSLASTPATTPASTPVSAKFTVNVELSSGPSTSLSSSIDRRPSVPLNYTAGSSSSDVDAGKSTNKYGTVPVLKSVSESSGNESDAEKESSPRPSNDFNSSLSSSTKILPGRSSPLVAGKGPRSPPIAPRPTKPADAKAGADDSNHLHVQQRPLLVEIGRRESAPAPCESSAAERSSSPLRSSLPLVETLREGPPVTLQPPVVKATPKSPPVVVPRHPLVPVRPAPHASPEHPHVPEPAVRLQAPKVDVTEVKGHKFGIRTYLTETVCGVCHTVMEGAAKQACFR